MSKTKQEIRQDLLAECELKGFRPGSLFMPKSDFWLQKVPGNVDGLSIEPHELPNKQRQQEFLIPGEFLMLVDVHVINNNGSWDFWFEFLLDGQTFYAWAYEVLGRLERDFWVKTNED